MRLRAILAGAAALAMLAGCDLHPRQSTLVVSATEFPLRSASSCGANSTGRDFVATKVHELANFNFTGNGMVNGVYTPPTVLVKSIQEPYATDLAGAFDLAPPYLKAALCQDVDDLFLDLHDQEPFGWSFWEVPGQDNGLRRYIAVGGRLWNPNPDGTQFGLADLEGVILDVVGPAGSLNGKVEATIGPDAAPQPAGRPYAIIAVLARELGLGLNHDSVRHGKLCGGKKFWETSWTSSTGTGDLPSELGQIRRLGAPLPKGVSRQGDGPSPSDIRRVADHQPRLAERELAAIYDTGKWANYLAYFSPDDDFVETYRMIVLKDSGVTHIIVPVKGSNPSHYPDTIADLDLPATILAQQKVACVRANFAPLTGAPPPPAPAPR